MPLNNKNILIVVAGDLASNYVTMIHPLNLLKKTYAFKFDVLNIKSVLANKAILDAYHLVIFIRIIIEGGIDIAATLMGKKIPLIYVFDDDFETLNNINIIRLSPAKNIPRICGLATNVIVTSNILYNKYKGFSKKINPIGDYIDIDMIDSFNIVKNYNTNTIKIGYASSDHNYDNLKIVLPALLNILKKYPHVSFECFFEKKLKELNGLYNVTYLKPIPNIYDYYKCIAARNWDIGIAPLENIIFNEAKSDIKYREYASLKIPGIYSSMPPYANITNDGILCNHNNWEASLEELINTPFKRLEIAKRAYYNISQILSKENVSNIYIDIFKYCFGVYK
jgi:glycosyltransferase involved in cell wall biosynthesis